MLSTPPATPRSENKFALSFSYRWLLSYITYKRPEVLRNIPFRCSDLQEHYGFVNDAAHIPASAAQSKITQGITTMLYHRRRRWNCE